MTSQGIYYLIRALVALVAIPFHECGHALAAWLLGDDTAKRQGRLFYGAPETRSGIGKFYPAWETPPDYQITVFARDFETPSWFRHGIVYQIFPDRFNRECLNDSARGTCIPAFSRAVIIPLERKTRSKYCSDS